MGAAAFPGKKSPHGEPGAKPKEGFSSSSLQMCWSVIKGTLWWQLIPTLLTLEGSLGFFQVLLINFVDPEVGLRVSVKRDSWFIDNISWTLLLCGLTYSEFSGDVVWQVSGQDVREGIC